MRYCKSTYLNIIFFFGKGFDQFSLKQNDTPSMVKCIPTYYSISRRYVPSELQYLLADDRL